MLSPISNVTRTTNAKIVLPFYIYAALSFLLASILLWKHSDLIQSHHFNPHTLSITHIMALGWGTMIILGASYQLLPVIIEGELDSERFAYLSFGFLAIGIPILVYAFYIFHTGWLMQLGAVMINIGILFYVTNVLSSVFKKRKLSIFGLFIALSSLWLFATTIIGLLLVFNFTKFILHSNSLEYLSLHAHVGIIGWFLLLVIGASSRLIPMFMISKYSNTNLLWFILISLHIAIGAFIISDRLSIEWIQGISIFFILICLFLYLFYNYKAYKQRIRKKIDWPVALSLLSNALMILPVVLIFLFHQLNLKILNNEIYILYGFQIFFGWLTAMILGMTFKTLPFIVWNIKYSKIAHKGKVPAPKDLFQNEIMITMTISYILGFVLFIIGYLSNLIFMIKIGVLFLLVTAVLYNWNVFKIILHKKYNNGNKKQ